jgi:signal transduction histidine kinase
LTGKRLPKGGARGDFVEYVNSILRLLITHKIIEDHRGTIEVMSEKGFGTTFILRLPVIGF